MEFIKFLFEWTYIVGYIILIALVLFAKLVDE